MKIQIRFTETNSIITVDDSATLSQIREAVPNFFRTPFGKRETFTMYRGQIIVRNTQTFSDGSKRRMTIPYLFVTYPNGVQDTFCISVCARDIKHAKKIIDIVLDGKTYFYNIGKEQ